MQKVVLLKTDKNKWEKDLNSYNHSIFISGNWIESVTNSEYKPIFIDFLLGNEVIAKIAGLILQQPHSKRKQLYFYASPAMKSFNQDTYNLCFDTLYDYAKNNNYNRIIVASYDNYHSYKYTGNKYFLTERVEFVVPLQDLDKIKSNTRFKRNVKKGQKLNPSIGSSRSTEYFNILLNLLNSTKNIRLKKHNDDYDPFYLNGMTEDSLKKLLTSGLAKIYFTTVNGSIDCMEFNLETRNGVYMLLKGTSEFGYKNGFPSFLSYNLIKDYSAKGLKYYNQGGRISTDPQDGLTVYKKSMGAEEITVYGATTNFLIYPYKLLNPLLNIGRKLPRNNPVVKFLKKFI